jgi:hypothetical protein
MRRVAPRAILLRDAIILAVIAIVSVVALKAPQLGYLYPSPWTGFGAVLPHTACAAIKVWTFWTVSAAILGGILLHIEPRLGLIDATIGGFTGVWIFAYIGGNALGPIGLFRTWTLWILLAAGGFWLWRRIPRVERRPLSPGQKLMLLTFALHAPGLLILQLGSPVPPFMDIFATPAAAQRIITFGRYLPFDNDPYGYWDAASQLPGLELFYAFLGLGSWTSLGVLAETAAIVPMAGLLVLTTYRLGKTLAGDVAGGFACLFLFATMLLRVLPYMHGRSVAFVLVAAGLGFFLDARRNRMRLALGALALGTAVASHAIIGALGMVVATAPVLFWLLSGEIGAALAGLGALAGASLVALPAVAIGLRIALPYPVLPAMQMLGIALIAVSAHTLHERTVTDRLKWMQWGLTLLPVYVLLWHPPPFMPNNHPQRFPLLVYGGGLGLVLMLWIDRGVLLPWRAARNETRPSRAFLGPVTIALLVAILIEYVYATVDWRSRFPDPRVQVALADLFYKVDYWYPYIWVFPAAYLAAWLYRTVSPRVTVFLVLALLFFPWRERYAYPQEGLADPNYHQHSITEAWSYQVETGKRGYWGATSDRRWAQNPAELELAEVLRREVAAGRITLATHVVHLGPYQILYKDNLLFSVYTGINDDGYIAGYQFDWSIAGGRLRPIEQLGERLAEHPPYVAIHQRNDPGAPDNVDPTPFATGLEGYTEIFNRDNVRLLRYDGAAQ